jgi:hypothetical protein
MSWTRARDALIAQTMAFVEEVAGEKPETKARVEIVPIDTIQQVERPIHVEAPQFNRPEIERPIQIEGPQFDRQGTIALPDVREEIRIRVESFRAHQHRFQREREEYSNSVLAKARASTGSEILPRRS